MDIKSQLIIIVKNITIHTMQPIGNTMVNIIKKVTMMKMVNTMKM